MTEAEIIDAGLPIEHRLRLAYEAARNRQDISGHAPDIWATMDAMWSRLQSRLYALERMRNDPNVTRQRIATEEAARPKIHSEALAEFQRWETMSVKQIPAALAALNPAPPLPSPETRAAITLADMRRRGFRFREAHKGELTVEPGNSLTEGDRSFLSAHKDYVLKLIRSEDNAWTC